MLDTSYFDENLPEQERAQLKEQERIKQELELAKKRSVRVTIDLLGRQVCCSPLLCFFVALLPVFSSLDGMRCIHTALHVLVGLLGCQVRRVSGSCLQSVFSPSLLFALQCKDKVFWMPPWFRMT